jgi:membrane associated rhomboid family serine protease
MGLDDRDYMSDHGGWGGPGPGGGRAYQPRMRVRFGPVMSPTVKVLLIVNAAVFVADLVIARFIHGDGLIFLAYIPYYALRKFYLWQFVTHMFMHGGVRHIAFNMFALWMFGCDVERRIGRGHFLKVYFLSGISGALLYTLFNHQMLAAPDIVTATGLVVLRLIGASGAVCGILVAFTMLFPERVVLLMFVFPLKVKYLVLGFFIFEVLNELSMSAGNIAHLAHLGGMIAAYFYMRYRFRLVLPFHFTRRLSFALRDFLSRFRFWRSRPRVHKYKPVNSAAFISEEVDPILEKISRHGINSLTWRERRILKRARSKMS